MFQSPSPSSSKSQDNYDEEEQDAEETTPLDDMYVDDESSVNGVTITEKGELKKQKKDEDLKLLEDTGLHTAEGFHKTTTLLIVELTMMTGEKRLCTATNVYEGHAEKRFLLWIDQNKTVIRLFDLTIYINYSPCPRCCKAINDFCERNNNVKIKLITAQLYYLRRPSCNDRGCKCHKFQKKKELEDQGKKGKGGVNHEKYAEALRMLHGNVTLLPFDSFHWRDLKLLLSGYTEIGRKHEMRHEEDLLLLDDFNKLDLWKDETNP